MSIFFQGKQLDDEIATLKTDIFQVFVFCLNNLDLSENENKVVVLKSSS